MPNTRPGLLECCGNCWSDCPENAGDQRLVRCIAWFCNESKEVNMEIRFNGWQWILLAFAIISGLAVTGIFRLVWWIVSHVRWV